MSKKMIRFIVFFMAVVVLCSCSLKGNDSTGDGNKPAGKEENTGIGGSAENDSAGELFWKRTELLKPEGAVYVSSFDYLADGTMRLTASDQDLQKVGVWDSKDDGSSWENADADMSMLLGNGYSYGFSKEGNLYTYDNESLTVSAGDGTEPKTVHTEQGEEFSGAAVSGNTLAVLVNNLDSWKLRVEIYDLRTMERRQINNTELSEYLTILSELGGNIALNHSGDVLYLSGNELGKDKSGIAKYDLSQDQFSYLLDQDAAEQMLHPGEDNGLPQGTEPVLSLAVNDTEDKLILHMLKPEMSEDRIYLCEQEMRKEEEQFSKDTLRIYALRSGGNVAQAASVFQERHPELTVTYETGYTGEDGVTLSDAIRTLNTELMAGEGPDILMLDGLPADSYIEKGILEDLTDIVEPEKENYFYNIISAYNKGENIYQIPTEFLAPILLGDAETVGAKNREELMEVLKKKTASGIPFIPSKVLAAAALNLFVTSDILGETLDEGKLADYYRDIKTLADLCLSEEEWQKMEYYEKMSYNAEIYPSGGLDADLDIYFDHAQAGIEKIDGLNGYTKILSVCKEKGMSYQSLNREKGNYFMATNVFGVNRNGKKPDAAKQFIREYLSGDLLTHNAFITIPVNRDLLWDDKFISEEGEYIGGISGKYTPEEVMPLYKITPAEMQELTAFLEGLDTPVKDDSVVLQKVMEQADACVFDGKDPESAAKDACSGVNLYLSE